MATQHAGRYFIVLLLLGNGLIACKFEVNNSKQGYILGSDDIQLFSASDPSHNLTQEAQDPHSMLMATPLILRRLEGGGFKFCSGNMLSRSSNLEYAVPNDQRLIVTNNHCFVDEHDDKTTNVASCADVLVLFGFSRETLADSFTVPCNASSLKLNSHMDLASFTIDDQADLAKGLDVAALAKEESVGLEAMIIHYPNIERNLAPHPQMDALLPLAAITQKNCKVTGVFNGRFADEVFRYGISHECDLTNGSSGSALLDIKSSKIIGINWGGVTYQDGDHEVKTNVATASSNLRQFLQGEFSADATTAGAKATPLAIEKNLQSKKKNRGIISCGVINAIPLEAAKTAVNESAPSLSLWAWAMAQTNLIDAENFQSEKIPTQKPKDLASLVQQLISLDFFITIFPTTTLEAAPATWAKLNQFWQDKAIRGDAQGKHYQERKRTLNAGKLELIGFISETLSILYPNFGTQDIAKLSLELNQHHSRSCQPPWQSADAEPCRLWLSLGMLTQPGLEQREDFLYVDLVKDLKDRQYRKILRQLYQRQQSFSQDRLLYDRVQSIFARSQRGSGQVAIDYP